MSRILFLYFFFFFFASPSQAAYVLPYPSSMPGSRIYAVQAVFTNITKFWYFGDFATFQYNSQQSDKKLVEAKVLFEYGQYQLGERALKESNEYFSRIPAALEKAKSNGKNISEKKEIFKEAKIKHIEVLNKMMQEVPREFIWIPEKGSQERLQLHKTLEEGIKVRSDAL